MSLCQHGYSAFWDCPLCECPGCGRPQDLCTCHLNPAPEYHGAAGPVAKPEAVLDPATSWPFPAGAR